MREFALKLCLFLFLVSLLGGRTELGTLTAAVTGTILLWPLYRRWMGLSIETRPQREPVERDANFVPAGRRLGGRRDAP